MKGDHTLKYVSWVIGAAQESSAAEYNAGSKLGVWGEDKELEDVIIKISKLE